MPDLSFISIFFTLIIFTILGYGIWDMKNRIYHFFMSMCIIDVIFVLWFALYLFTPYRIETTYEVKPEYNQNKTVQFITLKESIMLHTQEYLLTSNTFEDLN